MPLPKQPRIVFGTLAITVASIAIYFSPNSAPALQAFLFITLCLLLLGQLFVRNTNILSTINDIIQSQRNKRSTKDSNILVVDDNISNRKVMTEMLGARSLATAEAKHGKQALNLFKDNTFKLIFMDIEMDGMNGLEATRAIRTFENGQHRIPIVAVSAHTSSEKMHQALVAGCDDYLSKPIDDQRLTDTLERWLHLDDTAKKPASPTAATSTKSQRKVEINEEIGKVVDIKQSLVYSRNNPELAKDMLAMLIDLIAKERDNMVALFEAGQWPDLGQHVHKLSGGSCYCGVAKLQKYAEVVDQAIDQRQIEKAPTHFPKLLGAMDELLEWNEQHDLDIIFS